MSESFKVFSDAFREQFADRLPSYLPSSGLPSARLREAMLYSLMNGGKRVRPLLLVSACEALGGTAKQAMAAACAIECIHSYSLVHDDLPAMDDDDLRRGKPTCHIAFDEATAILAGDALQTLAFEIILDTPDYDADLRCRLLKELGRASGQRGMVAGQAVDLQSVGVELDEEALQAMHALKTGALIEASVLMGACIACPDLNPDTEMHLRQFARALGLAFQIRDDIIDVESDTATLGKTAGKDAASDKPTYTSLLGVNGAKHKLKETMTIVHEALAKAGLEGSRLAELATFVAQRTH